MTEDSDHSLEGIEGLSGSDRALPNGAHDLPDHSEAAVEDYLNKETGSEVRDADQDIQETVVLSTKVVSRNFHIWVGGEPDRFLWRHISTGGVWKYALYRTGEVESPPRYAAPIIIPSHGYIPSDPSDDDNLEQDEDGNNYVNDGISTVVEEGLALEELIQASRLGTFSSPLSGRRRSLSQYFTRMTVFDYMQSHPP
ncbi:hypothetical protein SEUCBS140593_003336 [Sporothrix eucalyptigena]|uniref:Uncharacterized protein n=1 Tax=Sporothrix eucalyptigena TaxID=1812306 RepID=A0ABP0BE13_9PEZI